MKICSSCKISKSIEDFVKDRYTKTGYTGRCRICINKKQQANPKLPERKRKEKYKQRYGITIQQYEELYTHQNGRCKLCHKIETTINNKTKKVARLSIDHNHQTKAIRGLLCNNCNRALGLFKDNTQTLENAIKYLKGELV